MRSSHAGPAARSPRSCEPTHRPGRRVPGPAASAWARAVRTASSAPSTSPVFGHQTRPAAPASPAPEVASGSGPLRRSPRRTSGSRGDIAQRGVRLGDDLAQRARRQQRPLRLAPACARPARWRRRAGRAGTGRWPPWRPRRPTPVPAARDRGPRPVRRAPTPPPRGPGARLPTAPPPARRARSDRRHRTTRAARGSTATPPSGRRSAHGAGSGPERPSPSGSPLAVSRANPTMCPTKRAAVDSSSPRSARRSRAKARRAASWRNVARCGPRSTTSREADAERVEVVGGAAPRSRRARTPRRAPSPP